MASYHCGLHGIVHKLWSWCQLDATLMYFGIFLLQMASYHCGLHGIVHKLWSWCQLDATLMYFGIFLFQMASYHCGLHGIVHKLWSWCQLDATLMSSIVALLTTYTSTCPAGRLTFTIFTALVLPCCIECNRVTEVHMFRGDNSYYLYINLSCR